MFILFMEATLEMNCDTRIFGILIDRTFLLKEEFLWLMNAPNSIMTIAFCQS